MARLTRRVAISDEETSDVESTRHTPNRSARAKSGVKYTKPGPLDLDEEDELAYKYATNGKVKDEDDEEEGEEDEEPEE